MASLVSRLFRPTQLAFQALKMTARPYSEVASLGSLAPAAGATHKRQRVGRGIGSGRGGTSGRGHKGKMARSGGKLPYLAFAGGQTPLTRIFPKFGFKNNQRTEYQPLNLERLQYFIDKGRLDPTQPITIRELYRSGCVHSADKGVKILADGSEHFKTMGLNLTVSRASKKAIETIERFAGTVVARFENDLTLKALVKPETFIKKGKILPGKADPIRRRDLVYYSNIENRGYLAVEKLQK